MSVIANYESQLLVPEKVALLCFGNKVKDKTFLVGASMLMELMLREEVGVRGDMLVYVTHPLSNYDKNIDPYLRYINNQSDSVSHLFGERFMSLFLTVLRNRNLVSRGLFGDRLTPAGKAEFDKVEYNRTMKDQLANYLYAVHMTGKRPALNVEEVVVNKLRVVEKYLVAFKAIR